MARIFVGGGTAFIEMTRRILLIPPRVSGSW